MNKFNDEEIVYLEHTNGSTFGWGAYGIKLDMDTKRRYITFGELKRICQNKQHFVALSKYIPEKYIGELDIVSQTDQSDFTKNVIRQLAEQTGIKPSQANEMTKVGVVNTPPLKPEILEEVIEEIAPANSSPKKPTKKKRGQILETKKVAKTYFLDDETIEELERLSKFFHLNLSQTFAKLVKIGGRWIEENGKDAEIKMINNKNDQLLEVIEKFAKLQNQFEASEEKYNKEIEALNEFDEDAYKIFDKLRNINIGERLERIEKWIDTINPSFKEQGGARAEAFEEWQRTKGGK